MGDASKTNGPRYLLDWPWIVVEVECSLCSRAGRYRLARLAEKYGAAAALGPLLVTLASGCGLPKFFETTRQYEARCGARYRVPLGGPLPVGMPAREAKQDDTPVARRRRRGPEEPLPTVGEVFAEGCTGVLVYCVGRLRDGCLCHHQGRIDLIDLDLPPDLPFIHVPQARQFRCSRCGSRQVEVRSELPDVRQKRAASLGVDTRQALPGTVSGYRMLERCEPPIV